MKKLIVILGPTASGKTELAIKLAKKFNGEIVSADSRQIYKEMDIGVAKPRKSQIPNPKSQKYLVDGIPHHLIDIIKPNEKFNVAIYKKLAIGAIKNIQKKGKLPFLVGGTGLYIWAVVDNLKFPKVAPQKKLRKKLEKKSEKELLKIYKKLDPEGAKFIEKENKRRLIRAIEVCKITGKSFWEQRGKEAPLFDVLQIGIRLPKEELEKCVVERTDKMFKMGLEKEAKKLFEKYGQIPPLQTIGYQEFKDCFEGKISKQKAKENIVLHTLQFARRQITWFKRDKRILWIKTQKEAKKIIKEFLKGSKRQVPTC